MIKNFEIHYRKWSFEQKERTLTEEARILGSDPTQAITDMGYRLRWAWVQLQQSYLGAVQFLASHSPPLSLFSSFEEGITVVSASADSCEDHVRNQEC